MWSKEPPSVPGWYWWRDGANDQRPEVARVYRDANGVLCASSAIEVYTRTPAQWGGEWQGPIAPQEDSDG